MINFRLPPYTFEWFGPYQTNKGNLTAVATSDLNKGVISALSVSDKNQASSGGAYALQGMKGTFPQGAKFVRIGANPSFRAAWSISSFFVDAFAEATIGLLIYDEVGKTAAWDVRYAFSEQRSFGWASRTLDSPGLTLPLTVTLPIPGPPPNWDAMVAVTATVSAAGWKGMGGSWAASYIAAQVPWISYEYF